MMTGIAPDNYYLHIGGSAPVPVIDTVQAVGDAITARLAITPPVVDATAPAVGTMTVIPRADHVHPTRVSSGRAILDANGYATVRYSRTFDTKPAVIPVAVNPTGRAVTCETVSDIIENGLYVGVKVHGYRSQLLPALSGIVLIGPMITALGNFDILGGSAAGVEVSILAVLSTAQIQVPTT